MAHKKAQVITKASDPDAMTVGDADQTLTSDHFTVNSGLTIAYTTNDAGICTIVSQKLHAVGAGTCVVSANQAGNAGWFAAAQVQSGNITISASGGPAINEAFNNVTNFTNVVNTVTASGGLGHGGQSGIGTSPFVTHLWRRLTIMPELPLPQSGPQMAEASWLGTVMAPITTTLSLAAVMLKSTGKTEDGMPITTAPIRAERA
jgi:hypothetical protein